jgi:hypothetical protein
VLVFVLVAAGLAVFSFFVLLLSFLCFFFPSFFLFLWFLSGPERGIPGDTWRTKCRGEISGTVGRSAT